MCGESSRIGIKLEQHELARFIEWHKNFELKGSRLVAQTSLSVSQERVKDLFLQFGFELGSYDKGNLAHGHLLPIGRALNHL
jgi:hypothetical protein